MGGGGEDAGCQGGALVEDALARSPGGDHATAFEGGQVHADGRAADVEFTGQVGGGSRELGAAQDGRAAPADQGTDRIFAGWAGAGLPDGAKPTGAVGNGWQAQCGRI